MNSDVIRAALAALAVQEAALARCARALELLAHEDAWSSPGEEWNPDGPWYFNADKGDDARAPWEIARAALDGVSEGGEETLPSLVDDAGHVLPPGATLPGIPASSAADKPAEGG